jgi:hypothetical protein
LVFAATLIGIPARNLLTHRMRRRAPGKIILAFAAETIISALAQIRTCLWSRVGR